MPIFAPIKKPPVTPNSDIFSLVSGTFVQDSETVFSVARLALIEWAKGTDSLNVPYRYFYNAEKDVSIVKHGDESGSHPDPYHYDNLDGWKFIRGNFNDIPSGDVNSLIIDTADGLVGNDADDFAVDFTDSESGGFPFQGQNDFVGIQLRATDLDAFTEFSDFSSISIERLRKIFVNDNGTVRELRKLWVVHDGLPRAIFYGDGVPSPTFFPLSGANDPTSTFWRNDNVDYTFVPYEGITTPTPLTDASSMFYYFTSFNDSEVVNWDVSNVTNMQSMFNRASDFNQDIGGWDVSNVTNMNAMFNEETNFNQDISSWDVSNVTNMINMFRDATNFSQDISGWNVDNVTLARDFAEGSGLDSDQCPSNALLGNFYYL